MTVHRLSYRERRVVEDLLRPRLITISEGYVKYKDNGSDAHVAAEARMKGVDGCGTSHVAYVRREMFGDLKVASEPKTNGHGGQSIELSNAIEELKEKLGAITYWNNLMMDYLTRTHGVDWTLEAHRRDKK